jgi:hypothetical protein
MKHFLQFYLSDQDDPFGRSKMEAMITIEMDADLNDPSTRKVMNAAVTAVMEKLDSIPGVRTSRGFQPDDEPCVLTEPTKDDPPQPEEEGV